jgi:hypothetical protein
MPSAFDIFRQKSDCKLIWVESAESLERAQERTTELSMLDSCNYVIAGLKDGEKRIISVVSSPEYAQA